MALKEGIVIRAVRGIYTVQSGMHLVHCSLRGNLKKSLEFNQSQCVARRVTRARRPPNNDAVSVGDRVQFAETQRGSGVIEEILPRTSRFSRQGFRSREQTLVSNLDQVLVVFACAEPRPDPWKLDRFLVAAEAAEIEPVIVANKRDLVTEEEFLQRFEPFRSLGYRVLPTSATEDVGIDSIRTALAERISAFVGPSGAGKSSLLNRVQPGLNLQTGEIGYVTYKGRHTTTAAQLIPLLFGGWVADTPGLRSMDLVEMDFEELEQCFPEMRPLVGTCRFDNCRHRTEPECAVRAAVESGAVQPRRYESFLTLAAESTTSGGRK